MERKVEQAVVDIKKQAAVTSTKKKPMPAITPPYEAHRARLEQHLHVPITISTNAKGAGKLTIAFKDEDELRRIEKLIGK